MSNSSLRIIVTGLIAQHPHLGGITWHYLQYVLGLARLGHDVFYFEDSGEWPYNFDGGLSGSDWVARGCDYNVKYLAKTLARFGLERKWAYRFPIESMWFGLSDQERKSVIRSADLLINVSGTLEHPEDYRRIPNLLYIDTDPVVTQIKLALGLDNFRHLVDSHDYHFTFGEHPSDVVPSTGHFWRATRQPIVLPEWDNAITHCEKFTTIMNWTSYKPLIYDGHTYGQKDEEFKQFLVLPDKVHPVVMEVALGKIEHADWGFEDGSALPRHQDSEWENAKIKASTLLKRYAWRVVDANQTCADLDSYRRYVQSSKAEWSVAKNAYVRGQPGWFSERSACYLAACKPVIVQDTGFSSILPVGEGILPFRTVEEAVAAIRLVETNYRRHAKAARNIAEEYFDSDKVLSRLIEEAMGSNN